MCTSSGFTIRPLVEGSVIVGAAGGLLASAPAQSSRTANTMQGLFPNPGPPTPHVSAPARLNDDGGERSGPAGYQARARWLPLMSESSVAGLSPPCHPGFGTASGPPPRPSPPGPAQSPGKRRCAPLLFEGTSEHRRSSPPAPTPPVAPP